MADMTFKANLLPNSDLGYSLGSSTQQWQLYGTLEGTATYAVNANYATSAGSANYAINAASATYANSSNCASHAIHSGSAGYALNAASATYANNSNCASHATHSASANYSTLAAQATHSASATFASNAEIVSALLTSNTAQAAELCYNESPGLHWYRYNGSSGQSGGDGWIMQWSWNSSSVGGQLYFDDNPSYVMMIRGRNSASNDATFNDWKRIQLCNGTGATGTWSISISGNAASATNADKVDNRHASDLVWNGGNMNSLGSGTPASNCQTYFTDTMTNYQPLLTYNTSGAEYTVLFSGRKEYGSILKWGYADTYLRILRRQGSAWKTTDWEKISAGYADSAGKATQDGSGNTITSKYVTVDTAQTITGNKSWGSSGAGGRLNGSATNGGMNSILIGDDCWMGDCNNSGIIALKSNNGTTQTGFFFFGSNGTDLGHLWYSGTGHSNVAFYGACWNDYAEMRNIPEANDSYDNSTEREIKLAGRCVTEVGDDTMKLTTQRLQRGCKVISDTFGFNIGETDDCKTPIAVSGRALVYIYEGREEARKHIGYPVCSGPDGTVSIMTDEEEEKYPSRIIGTISSVPKYETWGSANVKVNGRIWIYVK